MHEDEQNGPAGREQQPLLGVILCCTSIAPEQRDHIAAAAQEMGAITKLDLTSDVTHLIVGDTTTPKYKYVAKERSDIRVLDVAWLEAVRQAWMQDQEIKLAAFDELFKLPTFWNLRICITGFEDLQERSEVVESVSENGAVYNGDLTKAVTHLIAAAPVGKKYEYAGQWGIKIVGKEWLRDSLLRGMILEESLYHPTKPPAERGQGAVTQRKQPSPTSGKRTRDAAAPSGNRRKLRRTASTKLETQNSGIWADMGTGESTSATTAGAEWDDRPKTAPQQQTNQDVQDSVVAKLEEKPNVEQRRPSNETGASMIFDGLNVHIHGFDSRQTTILQTHLTAAGATLHSKDDMRERARQAEEAAGNEDAAFPLIVLVPSTSTPEVLAAMRLEVGFQPVTDQVLTDWWIEKCVYSKRSMPPDTPLCRPVGLHPLEKFERLLICPTSISGMDLLHFSKAVKLLGGRYDECLRTETSVLVCGGSLPNAEKLKYAVARGIPVVSTDWLWNCISSSKVEDYDEYLLIGSRSQKAATSQSQMKNNVHDAEQVRKPRLDLSKRSPQAPRKQSEPLQDITSKTNSQQRSGNSQRSQASQKPHSQTLEEAMREKAAAEPTHELANTETVVADQADETVQKNAGIAVAEETAVLAAEKLQSALAHLQARRQERPHTDTATTTSRRHRPLGRAVSNPSSLGTGALSIGGSPSSWKRPPGVEEEEDEMAPPTRVKDVPTMFRPSQALSYENEDAAAAREKLLKQSGKLLQEKGNMKRVESIGMAKDVQVASDAGIDRAGKKRAMRKR